MARSKRASLLLIAAGCIVALGAVPLSAVTECSAKCGCYCDSSYNECTMFCGASGWFAVCQNGFCDGPERKCCCYFLSLAPIFFQAQCSPNTDCGMPPPVQCALSQALPASIPSGKPSKDVCAALTRPGSEDHWYFVSTRIDANGVKSFHLPVASHDWLSTALQECASHGWIPKGWIPSGIPEFAKGMPIQSDFFDYIPSVDSVDVRGRLVRLSFPELADLSGDLAIRLEVTHEGQVLGKELLFSSDPKLGQLVLDSLEAGLEIVRSGSGPGPFVDILTLKFQNGELAVFGQTHHSKPQQ